MTPLIPVFIGYDSRERAAANVLIDSLYQHSSVPLAITPLVLSQLTSCGLYWRPRDPRQSTDFSFSRFLVPYLMGYQGWALFMDCDMLARRDIAELWDKQDDKYAVMCVHHDHKSVNDTKFLDEPQYAYPKKNWSSVMLFNCKRCQSLTPQYVNVKSGLALHQFHWLEGDHLIGSLPDSWNYLVDVQESSKLDDACILHWTLGGPWFDSQGQFSQETAAEWHAARESAFGYGILRK